MTDPNKCSDTRFEEAGPPGFVDPAKVYDPDLSQVIKDENDINRLAGNELSDPLGVGVASPTEPGTGGGPVPGHGKHESEETEFGTAYVLSLKEITDLCNQALNPQMISGLLVQMLVSHFRDESAIFLDELKGYVWSNDVNTNKIRITTLSRWDAKLANQLPAIIVARDNMQFTRMTIGDSDTISGSTGEEVFTRKVQCAYKIICLGGTPAESELLAFEVLQFITIFSPAFRRRTPIFNIEVDQLSGLVQIEEMSNKLGAFVTLHLEFPWTWGMNEQGPILKSFTLKTTATP